MVKGVYFVGSGFKGLIYMYMHVCFHVCSVLSCYVWMFFMYIVCIYMYVFMYMSICVCIYIGMCICACICLCLCMCWYTFLSVSYLFKCLPCRYLGCYLLVWHCYLGSILASSSKFQNLNTTISTKTSNEPT